MAERQVRSKARVADHGEVFTAEREVNAMLDLVKQETERVDSRFLEPACGNGNFLAEILRRKLRVVEARYGKSAADYEKYAVLAATSIYGVDILQDNVEECRKRLFDLWDEAYTAHCRGECREEVREAVRFILSRNILCGNALTLKKVDAKGQDMEAPIKVDELANTLQCCLDSGAKKVLIPSVSMIDFATVPADLMGAFQLIPYSSAEDAVFKALGVE